MSEQFWQATHRHRKGGLYRFIAEGVWEPDRSPVVIYDDESGQVWIAYNDPAYLVKRHAISDRAAVVEKMRKALGNFAAAATAK